MYINKYIHLYIYIYMHITEFIRNLQIGSPWTLSLVNLNPPHSIQLRGVSASRLSCAVLVALMKKRHDLLIVKLVSKGEYFGA